MGWDDFGAASVRLLSEATVVSLEKRWYSGVPRYAVPSFDRLPASVSVLGRNSGSGLVSYGVARSAAPSFVQPVLYGMFLRSCIMTANDSAPTQPLIPLGSVRGQYVWVLRNNEFRVIEGLESHNPTIKLNLK